MREEIFYHIVRDTTFLKEMNIMDYSLLIGIQSIEDNYNSIFDASIY